MARRALLCLVPCLLLAGCAGYQLGPTQERRAGAQSVIVRPFVNRTELEPRLSEALATSLRRQLQQDGTFRLSTDGDGDIIVQGSLVEFNRRGLTYVPTDTRTPRDYQIVLSAQVVATERSTGRKLIDQRVSGQSTIRVGNDLNTAERQGVPLVAEDLARNIASLLVDGTW